MQFFSGLRPINFSHVAQCMVNCWAANSQRLRLSVLGVYHQDLKLWIRARQDHEVDVQLEKLWEGIAFFLREPGKSTKKLLSENLLFLTLVEQRRNERHSLYMLRYFRNRIQLAQEQAFSTLTAWDSRSRILACFHFGDFVYGLNYLMCLEKPGRKCLLYSAHEASNNCVSNIRGAFDGKALGKQNQLIANETAVAKLSHELRSGACTLAMFCDLPGEYGEVVEVTFLNRRAHFPKGLAILAITTRTPVLPVITIDEHSQNRIRLFDLIDPGIESGEDIDAACARITQKLVSILEHAILRYPHQWRYLSNLASFYLSDHKIENTDRAISPTKTRMESAHDKGCPGNSSFQISPP